MEVETLAELAQALAEARGLRVLKATTANTSTITALMSRNICQIRACGCISSGVP